MKLVRQPKGSNLCGQACVATLAGTTLDHAIDLVGTRGETVTKQLKTALEKSCITCAGKRVRGFPGKDQIALLFWKSKDNKQGHWTVWCNEKHYDPAAGIFRKVPMHLEQARVTSYLKVWL